MQERNVIRKGIYISFMKDLITLMWDTVSLDLTLLWLSQSLTRVRNTSRNDNNTGEHLCVCTPQITSWIGTLLTNFIILYMPNNYWYTTCTHSM